MKKILFIIIVTLSNLFAFSNNKNEIRSVIHLIDYVSNDYDGAVKDGKVFSVQEYSELTEFNNKLIAKSHEIQLDTNKELSNELIKFHGLVASKASVDSVKKSGFLCKSLIVTTTGYVSYPSRWFDLESAKQVYASNCAKCHGQDGTGNGLEGVGLLPPPRNFYEEERMQGISPSNAYNTIRLGIEGTGMKGFNTLSDAEVWDLSFYVVSLRYSKLNPTLLKVKRAKLIDKISLEQLAESSDYALKTNYNIKDKEEIASLRLLTPDIDKKQYLEVAKALLDQAYSAYINNNYSDAENKGVMAYLEGIEPVELQIKSLQPHLVAELEKVMMLVRKNINDKVSNDLLKKNIDQAKATIDRATLLLKSEKKSALWTFFMSFTIIIREALEAMLILVILINLVRSANAQKAMKWINLGWISAIGMGAIAWIFSEKLVSIGMGKIEFFEGMVSIFSVILVLYIGFWMHSHTEINKWKVFVDEKIGKLIRSGNYKGLALLSFIVVGREVFESVLFLTAISANKAESGNNHLPIILGAIASVLTVIVISYIFINVSKNVPIRKLLRYSSIVLGLLAVILVGKSAHSFQETGNLSIHALPFDYKNDVLGIFPTVETTLLQVIIFTLVFLFLFAYKPKSKPVIS